MSITLYDLCGAKNERFSPYCWRAKMALAHKGLAFETRPTPFTAIAQIAGNSQKTVPVMFDGGQVVVDSFAIASYLEQHHQDGPSLFGGQGGLAMARFIESWAFTTLHPIILTLVVKDIHDLLSNADQVYFRQSREARLGKTLEDVQAGREDRLEAFY